MKSPISPALSRPSPEALAPDYYLANLQRLLAHIAGLYLDLLRPEEKACLNDFQALPRHAQQLYTRLLMRKGQVFRIDRFRYPEIHTIPEALKSLSAAGFIFHNPALAPEALLRLFTRAELNRWFSLPAACKPQRRTDQEAAIMEHYTPEAIVTQVEANTGWCELLQSHHFTVFQYLFFGNAHQDLAEFVMSDLGIVRYEPYWLSSEQRFFRQRERLDKLMQLSQLKACYWDSQRQLTLPDIHNLLAALPDPGNDNYLISKTDRLRNLLARELERHGDYDGAISAYQRSVEPPARERRTRLYAKTGAQQAAQALCEEILLCPQDAQEREFAEQFLLRMQGVRPVARHKKLMVPEQTLHLPCPKQAKPSVESLVVAHFQAQGWYAIHLENTLFNGLLGLFFWDIVFAPIPDAFFNPFQRAPRDLFQAEFRVKRDSAIKQRLAELHTPNWSDRIEKNARDKRDTANLLVNWSKLSEDIVKRLVATIPGQHLAVIFERMLSHLSFYRAGFPDLFLLDPQGRYSLAEVKGPGDTVQANQQRWLTYFAAQQIPAQLIWVRWHDT